METIYRIEVIPRPGEMPPGYLLDDIRALGIEGVERVERRALYFVQGDLTPDQIRLLCDEMLVDPIVEHVVWGPVDTIVDTPEDAVRVEVGLRQGVTDSVAQNILARAHLLGLPGLGAATAESYLLWGNLSDAEVQAIAERLLYNDIIQYYEVGTLTPHIGVEVAENEIRAETVRITGLDDEALIQLSHDRLLALDLAEMRVIREYYVGEGREPTDVELESLAQTWSEHCVHKTFRARVNYREITPEGKTEEEIVSPLRTYLQAATNGIAAPWVRSAFVDNAGIIAFGDYELSFKVETHNHPSALEPFGGANTGVGGVVRDIMGVSARPIANTDVLCFGPLDADPATLPGGVLHPRRLYNGVVHGIEDYGNKMGIPTVNGSIYFDPGYTGNPLVYCGCAGIAPAGAHPREARAGDLVVLIGGRTGRDGLHGATFSSIELTDTTGETSGGAVQIGNPIVEKMALDALLVARDEKLYNAVTDCGAGGLSSAVSEMGEATGAAVALERVPLKYVGLQPWEIWLSEAQERMVLAVPLEHEARMREICDAYSVEMTVLGEFTGDQRLHLTYEGETVADLQMGFLHGGLPRRALEAEWIAPPMDRETLDVSLSGSALAELLLEMLASPNVRSKEDVVRRYDHEVQAGTIIKPLVGTRSHGPGDATVIRPLDTHERWEGFALGSAFNPAYGQIDPYAMAISAIDEAVRNVVCVGADPAQIAILDNFCWGNPAYPDRMGGLMRALKGCYDGALHYATPFISGKDSLNNEYTDSVSGQQVAIPPSLLISSMGIIHDVRQTCTADLKQAGSRLYLLGLTRPELGGSLYAQATALEGYRPPGLAEQGPAIARALHRAITGGLVRACHDCSEGGLVLALGEMALAGDLGANLFLGDVPRPEGLAPVDDWLLYAESNGRYLVEVAEDQAEAFEALMEGMACAPVGTVLESPELVVHRALDDEPLFSLPVGALERAWRGHIQESDDLEGAR